MSARNYMSAKEKNNKIINCLPNINFQRFGYRASNELPVLSANTNSLINRNINCPFDFPPYILSSGERAGTPLSDFFSESETGTPDFRSEESDSSAGSTLRQNTAEATKILVDEWERIERTIYDEEGEKTMRPQMIEECKQWRQLHPHLRVVGKAIPLPEKRLTYRNIEHEEVIATHYSDYEEFSESGERLSESSTDVTPQNSPRVSIADGLQQKIFRERVTYPTHEEEYVTDSFCSLLHITPIQIRSPPRKPTNSSILKSDIASSKWMRHQRPDSSTNCDRNSAKSFVSLDTRNYTNLALSASERNKALNNRVLTAKHRLEPLYTPEFQPLEMTRLPTSTNHHFGLRKVSLPPLLLEEERRKVAVVSSAKKRTIFTGKTRKSGSRSLFQLDRKH